MNISTELLQQQQWAKTTERKRPWPFLLSSILVETEGMREAEKLVCILAGLALTAIQRLQRWVSAQLDSKMNQKVILNASGAQQLTSTNCKKLGAKTNQRTETVLNIWTKEPQTWNSFAFIQITNYPWTSFEFSKIDCHSRWSRHFTAQKYSGLPSGGKIVEWLFNTISQASYVIQLDFSLKSLL